MFTNYSEFTEDCLAIRGLFFCLAGDRSSLNATAKTPAKTAGNKFGLLLIDLRSIKSTAKKPAKTPTTKTPAKGLAKSLDKALATPADKEIAKTPATPADKEIAKTPATKKPTKCLTLTAQLTKAPEETPATKATAKSCSKFCCVFAIYLLNKLYLIEQLFRIY